MFRPVRQVTAAGAKLLSTTAGLLCWKYVLHVLAFSKCKIGRPLTEQ